MESNARVTVPRTLLALLAAAVLSAPVGVGAQSDPESERDDVRRRQDAVASELDVLEASNAQINAALDDLEDRVAAQEAALDDAEAAQAEAELAVRQAKVALQRAERDVALLEAAIREMAIASYVHPPTADLVRSLEAQSFSAALLQRAYLDARAKRDLDLLDLLGEAEDTAAERAAEVESAAAEAARAVEQAATALEQLQSERGEQAAFASRLQDRIDASLAEAAVLAEMDAELAAQIEAEQAALLARIPPPLPVAQPVVDDDPVSVQPAPTAPSTTTTTEPGSPPTTPTTPTTAPPARRRPPPSTSTPPLATVQGITVHEDIAADVDALLTAADADGVALSGWGYRSTDRQIQLRIQNCGPTDYDIWYRPPSLCSPPTAIPGRSMHERGRAIDFTYEGRTITSRSNVGFQWLADNAASYGLFNLPSEPWHWSTSGG